MTLLKRIALAVFALFALAQFVPYGRSHHNPPVGAEPVWPSEQVRTLAQRACFDCHSNQSRWPWYAYVAPASWLVEYDVTEGREHLNFSEWGVPQEHAEDAAEELLEGEMPPRIYTLMHREALLTPAERQALADGLRAIAGGGDEHVGLDVD